MDDKPKMMLLVTPLGLGPSDWFMKVRGHEIGDTWEHLEVSPGATGKNITTVIFDERLKP